VLLAGGRIECAGPVDEVLTSAAVSHCFSVAVVVSLEGSRWSSRARAGTE
jgi:hypothetical protein